MTTVTRYHDFCAGHRVVGHESKCKNLHGHNYRVHFEVAPDVEHLGFNNGLDNVGRVVDFSVIKTTLCQWLEDNWDHKMILWEQDPYCSELVFEDSVVEVPFNPTAENMAWYLVEVVAPPLLMKLGVQLIAVTIEETRKCSVRYAKK
jgi:6-pyruvoyltetrahydropterin/6-carboxytetrahydropterin synthase